MGCIMELQIIIRGRMVWSEFLTDNNRLGSHALRDAVRGVSAVFLFHLYLSAIRFVVLRCCCTYPL